MKKHLLILLLLAMQLHSHTAKAQACPNGDFENWNVRAYSEPDSSWYTSNSQSLSKEDTLTVWPVAGFSNQAIHIQTAIVGTDTLQAYITNTQGDPTAGKGGVPYSQSPTTITGYYRYNLPVNDSAVLIVVFKKAGTPISEDIFKIRNATGSVATFTAFSFTLSSLPVTPDSVIVAAASSNVFGTGLQSGSWLELDQVEFAGTSITQALPGGSFDLWTPDTLFTPVSWSVGQAGPAGGGVVRSTTHYGGNYSVRLTSQPSGGGGGPVSPAQITTGIFQPNSGPAGGLPYTRMTDTLSGYYMYTPSGTDTGHVNVSLSAAGSMAGGGMYNFTTAASWTYFMMPIMASTTPDSMRIDVQSSSFSATTPGSVLYLDHMQLKSNPLPNVGVQSIPEAAQAVTAYPNPANDILNIKLDNMSGTTTISLTDMMGRILDKTATTATLVTFPIQTLPTGMYIYEVVNNGNITRGKFIRQ